MILLHKLMLLDFFYEENACVNSYRLNIANNVAETNAHDFLAFTFQALNDRI